MIKYKLHGDETPYFVEDGGYFDKDGYIVGISKDDIHCDIPPHIEKLKKKDVESFIDLLDFTEINGDITKEEFKANNKKKIKKIFEKLGGSYE